jgi:gluconate 2-dehydrogenase gamma chain
MRTSTAESASESAGPHEHKVDGSPSSITRREALRRTAVLLGAAISGPTVAGVLAGCGRDAPGARGLEALSADEHRLVGVIAEHIIPETDTPGALGVGVPDFIDEMLADYFTAAERTRFLAGLTELDHQAMQAHGERFVECAPHEQLALLAELDREVFAPPPPPPPEPPPVAAAAEGVPEDLARAEEAEGPEPGAGPWIHAEGPRPPRREVPFFRTMKELTVVGYYTSEIGATRELRHESFPGRYEGCIPFSDIGRTWAV